MPTLKQKNVIKSYKLRLQEKLKTITEETEKTSLFLNGCVLEFQNRVDQILKIKDEKCLSLYRKLIRDLESYSEKLFILQASIEETSDEDSECSNEEQSTTELSRHQSQTILHQFPQTESKIPIPSFSQDVNTSSGGSQNNDIDSVADDAFCSLQSVEAPSPSLISHIDACPTVDLKISESNISEPVDLKISESNISEPVDLKISESNISESQNSCYCSISSNISESFACKSDSRSVRSLEAAIQESNAKDLFQSPSDSRVILPPVFEVSSKFTATLSHVVDPGNFWLQIKNTFGYNLTFPISEYIHWRNLSSIKKGTYCLAPFKLDSMSSLTYYRVQSLSDAQSALEKVRVLFIDHGLSEGIPLPDLRPLPEFAYSVPALAIHCYLYGIVPPGGSWSEESIERLKDYQINSLDVSVISKEDLYGVELTTIMDTADLEFSADIAAILCFNDLAVAVNGNESLGPSISSREHSKSLSNQTNSSLDILDSYNANAISNDSGVSVSSSQKSNIHKKDEIIHKDSVNCVPQESIKISKPTSSNRNLVISSVDTQVKDLILFDSRETLEELPNSCENIESLDSCPICGKKDFCLHLEIPSPSLSFVEKDMVLVMLSSIVSPSEFYVNMAQENIMTLDDLREQMTCLYDSQVHSHQVKAKDLCKNMYCAGRFDQDKYWYRIKILRISSEDIEKEQALVQYVDYGNVEIINCRDMQPLTESFSQHPIFAIKCSLAGVTPLDTKKSEWDEDAIKEFKNLTSYERCLTAQICTNICLVRNGSYPVLLWDSEDSKDLLINSLLAERKAALFDYSLLDSSAAKQSDPVPHTDMDRWDPMKEEYYQIENSYDMDDENLEVVTTGYQANDERYTCKYFSLRGYCPRGDKCWYEHHTLLETGVTRDQEEVFCLDTPPVLAESVNNILLQVSAINSPGCFYAILPYGCKTVDEIDQLIYNGASEYEVGNDEAKALFCALDKHYSKSPFRENTNISLSCGTIVVAKRQFDNKWHRARIVDVVGVDKPAKVFFVDSGDQQWVPRKLIRTILPQFLHTPFQAIQCSLYQVDPIGYENGMSWSLEAVQYFKDLVMEEMLLAETVLRIGPVFQVSLRKTTQDNHEMVSHLLISAGFAQPSQSIPVDNKEIVFVPG